MPVSGTSTPIIEETHRQYMSYIEEEIIQSQAAANAAGVVGRTKLPVAKANVSFPAVMLSLTVI